MEYSFTCPYCWETITMLLDMSVDEQSFIEDCEVCCHPIDIHYSVSEDAVQSFEAGKAQ